MRESCTRGSVGAATIITSVDFQSGANFWYLWLKMFLIKSTKMQSPECGSRVSVQHL